MTRHEKIAVDLFNQGYNCSQSVYCAFCDVTGMDRDEAFKNSSSLAVVWAVWVKCAEH
jgi:uncharacterized protein YycO